MPIHSMQLMDVDFSPIVRLDSTFTAILREWKKIKRLHIEFNLCELVSCRRFMALRIELDGLAQQMLIYDFSDDACERRENKLSWPITLKAESVKARIFFSQSKAYKAATRTTNPISSEKTLDTE